MAETTGFTIWLTGMSGAGKSTLAQYLGARLEAAGCRVEILDEEDVRAPLMTELGTDREARDTYIRRIGWVADLLTRNEVVAIVAATSPYRDTRDEVRRDIGEFIEVFCDCPVETLIERDVKGLYKKALAGEIPNFTGITEPYEPPVNPEVTVDSGAEAVQESAEKIIDALRRQGVLSAEAAKVALFGKGRGARRLARSARAKPARAAKKPAAKKPAAKAPAKKAPAKKAAAKKTPPKKAPAKKTAKPAARKAAKKVPKKAPKKPAGRKATGREASGKKTSGRGKKPAGRSRTVSRPARRAAKVAKKRSPKKGRGRRAG